MSHLTFIQASFCTRTPPFRRRLSLWPSADEKESLLCCSKSSIRLSLFHARRLPVQFIHPPCLSAAANFRDPAESKRDKHAECKTSLKPVRPSSIMGPPPHVLKAACLIFSPLLQVFSAALFSTRVLRMRPSA